MTGFIIALGVFTIFMFLLFIYCMHCVICIRKDTKIISDFCVWYSKNQKKD